LQRYQNVRGFDIPMNDPFLVGVLDCSTDLDEQFKTLPRQQLILIAVIRDFNAEHQLHDKKRTPAGGHSGIKDFGDIGMIHERERLALGFEPGYHLRRVHAQFDHLKRHPSLEGVLLFRHEHDSATAFPDLFEYFVTFRRVTELFPLPRR
jgi:hypothetical protein